MTLIATAGPYVACNTMPEGYKTHVATIGLGWFVAAPTDAANGDLEGTARLLAAAPTMRSIIVEAERFVSGFDQDELQDGISGPTGLLARMRAVIDGTPPAADPVKHQLMQALKKVETFLKDHADAISIDDVLTDVETAIAVGEGTAPATTVADEILRDLMGALPVPAADEVVKPWARGLRYITLHPTVEPVNNLTKGVPPNAAPIDDKIDMITVLSSWIDKLCDKLEGDAVQTVDDVCDVSLAREAATLARRTHGVSAKVLGYSVSPSVWNGTGEPHANTTFIVYTPDGDRLEDDFGSEPDAWAAAQAHALQQHTQA